MDYNFLEKLDEKELKCMKEIFTNTSSEGTAMLEAITLEESRRIEKSKISQIFASSRLENYSADNVDACNSILDTIEFDELYFFLRSFIDPGNKRRSIHRFSADYFELSKIYGLKGYGLSWFIAGRRNLLKSYALNKKIDISDYLLPISKMDIFFSAEQNIINYENVYNTYNYIKNYVFKCLSNNKEATKEDVFKDYDLKKEIVRDHIGEVAKYLYDIRGDSVLRLSVANGGLSRTAKKVGEGITIHQQRMIEAVAFGSSLENLEVGDYHEAKRLIYLPRKDVK